jgi:hypothetical protein
VSACPENVGQVLWGQRHQVLQNGRQAYTTLGGHDVREDTNYRSHRRISFKCDRQTDTKPTKRLRPWISSDSGSPAPIWYSISYCSSDFHPPFFQTFLTHSLSSVFLQLSTRFTQTHASLHFNECWCNRGSDELAVNQGLVNVNELPIVWVGKVGEMERERCVFVCLCVCHWL